MTVALKMLFIAAALRGFGSSNFSHRAWLIILASEETRLPLPQRLSDGTQLARKQ
jgi:hypothetical protein